MSQPFPEKDVQTWLRLTSQNLYTRRRQLDTKSSMLLSICAVLLTLEAGTIYPRISDTPVMMAALLPVVLAHMGAMFLSVSAMRPARHGDGVISPESLADGTARVTTFEHFHGMDEPGYVGAVKQVLRKQSFVYDSLVREIHEVGVELASRYRKLQRGYRLFMFSMLWAFLFVAVVQVDLYLGGL